MPKRSNKQIRLDTFAELQNTGRLDIPLYNKPSPSVVKNGRFVKRDKPPDKRVCCIDKYGDKLPHWFRPCVDCFRETEMQEEELST